MTNVATLLHVMADLAVMAGLAPSLAEAQALIRAKVDEHAGASPDGALCVEASALGDCPSCPLQDPSRRAAWDGMAGAFLQISEHMELLAEAPRLRMVSAPAQTRAIAQASPQTMA